MAAGWRTFLQSAYFVADLILSPPELLLEPPQQFVIFTFGERQIVIRKVRVLLLQFPFYFVPRAFEF